MEFAIFRPLTAQGLQNRPVELRFRLRRPDLGHGVVDVDVDLTLINQRRPTKSTTTPVSLDYELFVQQPLPSPLILCLRPPQIGPGGRVPDRAFADGRNLGDA